MKTNKQIDYEQYERSKLIEECIEYKDFFYLFYGDDKYIFPELTDEELGMYILLATKMDYNSSMWKSKDVRMSVIADLLKLTTEDAKSFIERMESLNLLSYQGRRMQILNPVFRRGEVDIDDILENTKYTACVKISAPHYRFAYKAAGADIMGKLVRLIPHYNWYHLVPCDNPATPNYSEMSPWTIKQISEALKINRSQASLFLSTAQNILYSPI